MLIGVSFALLPNKGGALMYLGVALGVGLIYYAAIITSTALGKEGFIPPLLSCTITEWRKAVPTSQGIKEAFSTGSQAQ